MTTNHEELRKLAEAATPGPWVIYDIGKAEGGTESYYWVWQESRLPYYGAVLAELNDDAEPRGSIGSASIDDDRGTAQENADAKFIAAANPQTVIALLKENEKLRAVRLDLDELESLAWAVAHLIDKHGYDALSGRDHSRVVLKDLYEKLNRAAAALGLTAGQEGESDEC